MSDMSLRPRSQRLSARASRMAVTRAQHSKPTEVLPGLNDITDAFEAFPAETIKYFTLYKEIDAKYSSQIPVLHAKVDRFRKLANVEENREKRVALMKEISQLLSEILPCVEEKMHIASLAADHTAKYTRRINDDYDLIFKHEIPDHVKFGQHNHPAIIHDSKVPDNKSAHSQRSESRREALAAKKAAHEHEEESSTPAPSNSRGKGRPRAEKEATPAATSNATKKRKTNSAQTNTSNNANSNGANNNAHGALEGDASKPWFRNGNVQLHTSLAPSAHAQLMGHTTAQAQTKSEEVSRPATPSGSKRSRTSTKKKQEQQEQAQLEQQEQEEKEKEEGFYRDDDGHLHNSLGDLVYCYCNQVSYGEMVGCDDEDCKREWFHLPCTGLTTLPRGKWYCNECKVKRGKR